MTSHAINAPLDKENTISAWVWYNEATALKEGQAVCYNWNYGTATTKEPRRGNEVENPTTLNAQYFAGVASKAYTASTGGQFIEIHLPGSICNILVSASTVIGVGLLTFGVATAGLGQFKYAGLAGEGSAIPMQTTTYVATAQLCLARLQVGSPSGGVELVTAVDNAAIGTLMIGGTTLITGAALTNGDGTYTLADATTTGLRKKFGVITTEITTNDLVITVTTGRVDSLADADLATVTFAGASTTVGTMIELEWGGAWSAKSFTKTMPALA